MENAVSAFFTYSRLAEFLTTEIKLNETETIDCLKIEFRGEPREQNLRENVPPCLWKSTHSLEIQKDKFQHAQLSVKKGLACDFYLKSPFRYTVGEIKVIDREKSYLFNSYKADLDKCKRWLSDEVATMVENKWHLEGGFRYALAILMDLNEGQVCRPLWQELFKGKEDEYINKGIIPRFIAAPCN